MSDIYPYYSDEKIAYEVRDHFCWHLKQRDTWKFGKKELMYNREDFYRTIELPEDEQVPLYSHMSSKDYIDDKIGDVGVSLYLLAKQCLIHGYMCVGKVKVWKTYEDDKIIINISVPFFYTKDKYQIALEALEEEGGKFTMKRLWDKQKELSDDK